MPADRPAPPLTGQGARGALVAPSTDEVDRRRRENNTKTSFGAPLSPQGLGDLGTQKPIPKGPAFGGALGEMLVGPYSHSRGSRSRTGRPQAASLPHFAITRIPVVPRGGELGGLDPGLYVSIWPPLTATPMCKHRTSLMR